MERIGEYDGGLQMFVEEARTPDLRRLHFLRWLIEHDRYDHPAAGPPGGELAPLTDDDGEPAPTLGEDGEQPPLSSSPQSLGSS